MAARKESVLGNARVTKRAAFTRRARWYLALSDMQAADPRRASGASARLGEGERKYAAL